MSLSACGHTPDGTESLAAGPLTLHDFTGVSPVWSLTVHEAVKLGAGEFDRCYGVIEKVHTGSRWSWSSLELHSHALQACRGAVERWSCRWDRSGCSFPTLSRYPKTEGRRKRFINATKNYRRLVCVSTVK